MLEILPSRWTKYSITQYLPLNEVSLLVSEFGMDDFSNQNPLPKRTSLSFGIHVILKGKGKYLLGQKTFDAQEGDVLVSMPGHMINYIPDEKEPWMYFWILFNGKNAPNLLNEADFSFENPIYSLQNKKEAFSIIHQLLQRKKENRQFQLRTLSTLCDLFSLIIEERSPQAKKSLHGKSFYVESAIRMIEARYCDPEFTIGELSKALAINQAYLCQLFRTYTGSTASQYLIEYRILQARVLLDKENSSIKEAAIATGYNDYNHFIKQFKKTIGLTPKEYRLHQQQNKKENE